MQPHDLPVYQQRDRILQALEHNRVIVVESPTGSGKTTQLPLILHEAGYSIPGVVGVTQPRRIAAVSVSDFIARQIGQTVPGLVGYKMRFDDRTTLETRIKIMTDGILLQEIKADQRLSQYSVIMVDEAHERSLNIDFVLGLLKRALELRSDLRIIVSSATINADVFSAYFDGCPVVRIDTQMYPVQIIYDDPQPQVPETFGREQMRYQAERLAYDAIVDRVAGIVERLHNEPYPGDVLAFLSGEQMIKDCMTRLQALPIRKKLHILPLYGRLSKEEQDRVFPPPPAGKTKIVLATNIAETSITIDGITVVIDSGLAKINFYNPKTFTSSLIESPVAKAGANQRRGRAGRTRPGRCYRLYSRQDFENRPLFMTEEIYRTDLSEVVLRMAELGIRDFEEFDFISSPGARNIVGAVETLRLLDAIDEQRELTPIGRMMAVFPLSPRHSRIIVEAIRTYPQVLEEALIAVSFLTSQTPFVLPPGEELAARKAHHRYRDAAGDFVSYLRLFAAYTDAPHKGKFCDARYLDERTMAEIANVKQQLGEIVGEMGIPISSNPADTEAYLSCIARGLIQFVCVHVGKGAYQSLTAERILIHPGSVMFRETPQFIVAGEVVRTSRTYARSVSPLQRDWLQQISQQLYDGLTKYVKGARRDGAVARKGAAERDTTWQIQIAGRAFKLLPGKGKKKIAVLPWHDLIALYQRGTPQVPANYGRLKSRIEYGAHTLLDGETLANSLRVVGHLMPAPQVVSNWPRKKSFDDSQQYRDLVLHLSLILQLAPVKKGGKQLGFVALYASPRDGRFWFKPTRNFLGAVQESLASLDQLADTLDQLQVPPTQIETLNAIYRRLAAIIESDD